MSKRNLLAAMSGGDPVKPKDARKALEIAQAEAAAKSFAIRRGLLSGEATHTGGVVPAVSLDGKPIPYGSPLPGLKKNFVMPPKDATELHYDKGKAYFLDPRTGNLEEMDPALINLPQFKVKTKTL